MATILPGSPPAFDKNNVEGTVKALCAYVRGLHENLSYTLGQMDKELSGIKGLDAEQSGKISNLQTGLTGALSLMNEQYTELNARVSALEQS